MRLRIACLIVFLPFLLHACHREEQGGSPDTTSSAATRATGEEDLDLFTSSPRESREQMINRYVRRTSKSAPITAEQYLAASCAAIDVNDYEASEVLADESIKLSPKKARAYLLRGQAQCSTLSGKYENALADVEKARELGLKDPDLYMTLGKIYDGLGRTREAIDALSQGIALYPELRKLYKSRASLNLALGEKDKTLLDYDQILKLDPRDSLCLILRAQLYERAGENEKALDDYQLAARPDPKEGKIPKRPVALKFRAILLDKLGRHQEAVADLTAALELDRQDDEVRRLRAVQYIALKKFDLALADLNRAIENGPEFAQQAYLDRATVYELTGKTDLAQQDRQSASRLKKKPAERPLFELKDSQ